MHDPTMKRNSNGVPNVFTADELKHWDAHVNLGKGRWVAARPLGYSGYRLVTRFKIAWKVFTGQYDALRWIED